MALSAEDRLDAMDAVVRMYAGVDNEDAAQFASLYTEDGVFSGSHGNNVGPAAIETFLKAHIATGLEHGVRHHLTNWVFTEAEGGGVAFTLYVLKMEVNEEMMPVATADGAGICVKTPEGWRVKSYHLTIHPAYFTKILPKYQ